MIKKGLTEYRWHKDAETAKKNARKAVLIAVRAKKGWPVGAQNQGVVWDRNKNLWKAWAYQEYATK